MFEFMIPTPKDKDLKLVIYELEQAIKKEKGEFSGTVESGTFSGNSPLGYIKGKYEVLGDEVKITITSKPMLVPQRTIIAKVKEYFGLK
jgi:hypothetical protein